ncbi:MAG: TerB family tellurite resistance protein [Cyclobacteriaceae bacterium]
MDAEYQEKLSHINDLIKLSRVDGQESHMEMNFINSVADRLGLDREDVQKIKTGSMAIDFSFPKQQHKVIDQFHRLILLMGIDKIIKNEEIQFCFDLGLKMGLNPAAVLEVIKKSYRNPGYLVQKDEMDKIFKKYLN